MSHRRSLIGALSVILLGAAAVIGFGAAPAQTDTPVVEVLQVDLNPLIDTAARDRNRFALDIPHVVDAAQVGKWSVAGAVATWRYTVRIPTAVSLSFHAANILLPPSAQLSVRG